MRFLLLTGLAYLTLLHWSSIQSIAAPIQKNKIDWEELWSADQKAKEQIQRFALPTPSTDTHQHSNEQSAAKAIVLTNQRVVGIQADQPVPILNQPDLSLVTLLQCDSPTKSIWLGQPEQLVQIDVTSGQVQKQWPRPQVAALSPDHQLSIGYFPTTQRGQPLIEMWDLQENKSVLQMNALSGVGPIDTGLYNPALESASFSQDGRWVAIGLDFFDDELPNLKYVQIWDRQEKTIRAFFRGRFPRFIKDDQQLAYLDDARPQWHRLVVIDLKTYCVQSVLPFSYQGYQISPDGERMIAWSDRRLEVWKRDQDQRLNEQIKQVEVEDQIVDVQFSHDFQKIILATRTRLCQCAWPDSPAVKSEPQQ